MLFLVKQNTMNETEFSSAIDELLQQDDCTQNEENDDQTEKRQPTLVQNPPPTAPLQAPVSVPVPVRVPTPTLLEHTFSKQKQLTDDYCTDIEVLKPKTNSLFDTIGCLEREDVYRMVCFSVLFLLFNLPFFMEILYTYFPLFFNTDTVHYNTFGVFVTCTVASILFHLSMR